MASTEGLKLVDSVWAPGREGVQFDYVTGTSSLTDSPIDSIHIVQCGDFVVLDRAQYVELFNFIMNNCQLTYGETDFEW